MKGLRLVSFAADSANLMPGSELTWFMKGLRLLQLFAQYTMGHRKSELTWFMKGLRHLPLCVSRDVLYFFVRIDLIYEGIATHKILLLLGIAPSVRIDLIYEGIATQRTTSPITPIVCRSPNWPDLWRDCGIVVETGFKPVSTEFQTSFYGLPYV